jgi:hypothetical protein
MKKLTTLLPECKKIIFRTAFVYGCLMMTLSSLSQVQSVTTLQNLSFGTFSQGSSGGTVTVSATGSRSVTGTVIPFNFGPSYFQAIFDVQAPSGTIISILAGPDATLTGSHGGRMTLQLGVADKGSTFVSPVDPPSGTQVSIGGTLIVGDAAVSPPGTYTGTFYITFNNE